MIAWEYIGGMWYDSTDYEPDGVISRDERGLFQWWAKREGEAAVLGTSETLDEAKRLVEQWIRRN